MAESLLCDDQIKVVMGGSGERALIYVKEAAAIRFWCDTFELEVALMGEPIELEAFGGSCRIEVQGEQAKITFRPKGGKEFSCTFPKASFANSVREIRSTGPGFLG